MDKMRGVVVVLYVRDFFGRIKKDIFVLHGRHNSPKRTIIRTVDMDVISSSQRRQWHFSWHYHSPLRLSTIPDNHFSFSSVFWPVGWCSR